MLNDHRTNNVNKEIKGVNKNWETCDSTVIESWLLTGKISL